MPSYLSLNRPEDLLTLLPNRPSQFRPGHRVPGTDWELIEPLGTGGFGEVWKARNVSRPGSAPQVFKFCTDPTAAATLRTEAALFDRIEHLGAEGLVKLHETYLSADSPCLRYEFIEGGELTALIRSWHADGKPPLDEILTAWRQIVGIVATLHQADPPIVHRDLKPANILVQSGGRGFKIADLGIGGIAAMREDETGTFRQATILLGACSPLYASREQRENGKANPKDDVHALGVILYQMLTGDLGAGPPTDPEWQQELKARYPNLPNEVPIALASCFKRADKRPTDATALDNLSAVNPVAESKPVQSDQGTHVESPSRDAIAALARQLPDQDGRAWAGLTHVDFHLNFRGF